jgi:hypothetical protein
MQMKTLATYVQKQLKHMSKTLAKTYATSRQNTCKHMSGKTNETLEHTLEHIVYSHCNMCNIPIYFYNIKMKHLQHPDKTSETLETYAYMGFQRNVILLWTNRGLSLWSLMPAQRSTATQGAQRDNFKRSSPPHLLAGATVTEACRLGGGDNSERAAVVERSRGEYGRDKHGRAGAGSAVEAAAHDRATRWRHTIQWRRVGARKGTVENFIFSAGCG